MISAALAGPWFAALVNLGVQSAVVLAAAALLLALCRARSAAARHLIAASGLVAILVLPLLGMLRIPDLTPPQKVSAGPGHQPAAAGPNVPDLGHAAEAGADMEPAVTYRPAIARSPIVNAPRTYASPAIGTTVATDSATTAAPASVASIAQTAAARFAVPILVIWLAGATLLSVWFASGYVRLALLARRFPPLEDSVRHGRVQLLAHAVGYRGPIALVHDTPLTPIAVPITWGARRPFMLLPRDTAEWPEARLQSVVLHELAHIRRHDWTILALARMACTLYWFHPLVWYLLTTARSEAERACDDTALAFGVEPTEYAGHLLETVRTIQRRRMPAAAISMARDAQVTARMKSILQQNQRRGALSRPLVLAATAIVAIILAPVAALRPISAQTQLSRPTGGEGAPTGHRIEGQSQIQDFLVKAGVMPVIGPGVEVTLSDNAERPGANADPARRLIRDRDISELVNSLYGAGAEAVSVGDERVTARTAIVAVGAEISVNGVRIRPPFVVRAIGKQNMLEAGLQTNGSPYVRMRNGGAGMARLTFAPVLTLPGRPAAERRWSRSAAVESETEPTRAQIRYLESFAGLTERVGPGVAITLRDGANASNGGIWAASMQIRDSDILALLNQLRASGAEEISVGEQRVVANTSVQSAGTTILVNGAVVAPPIVIRAIGSSDDLLHALRAQGGVIDQITRDASGVVRIESATQVRVPAYRGPAARYAHTSVFPAFQEPHNGGPSGETITLSDGTGVELIGVGASPDGSGEDWWKPDGTPLTAAPVLTNNRFHNSYTGVGTQYLARSLFFRLHGRIEGQVSTTGMVVDPSGHLDKDGLHHGRDMRLNDTRLAPEAPASGAVLLAFPKSETKCSYRFGIAAGPWETVAVTRPVPEFLANAVRAAKVRSEDRVAIVMDANPAINYPDVRGHNHAQSLTGGHGALGEVARRVVLLDASGKEIPHDVSGVGYDGNEMIYLSGTTVGRIAEIRLETRPYLWAEFKNISLQPLRGQLPAPIATPAPLPAFRHTFACGLTISINGVTERKADGGRWWLPGGRSLAGPLREYMNSLNFTGWPADWKPRAILTRHSADRNVKFSEAWQSSSEENRVQHMYSESDIASNTKFSNLVNVANRRGQGDCTLRFGVAAGPWQSRGRVAMPGDVRRKSDGDASFDGDISLVVSSHPALEYTNAAGKRIHVPFLANDGSVGDAARLVVGIDRAGHEVHLEVTATGAAPLAREPADFIALTFSESNRLHQFNRVDLTHIKEFRLKTRPYEWAEFRGIRLEPNM